MRASAAAGGEAASRACWCLWVALAPASLPDAQAASKEHRPPLNLYKRLETASAAQGPTAGLHGASSTPLRLWPLPCQSQGSLSIATHMRGSMSEMTAKRRDSEI